MGAKILYPIILFTMISLNSNRIVSLLDCINRPFDYHPDGRVPDGNPNATMQLVDYYDDNGVYTPILSSEATEPLSIDGFGIIYGFGQNDVRSQTYDITSCLTRGDQLYGPIYFFVGATGQILTILGADAANEESADSAFWSNDPVNLSAIVGSETSYDYNTGMVNSLRVLSAGLRMWPTIELITDSNTLAVSRYYGCQITPASISNAQNDGTNIYSVMRNSPSYYEYANSQGISARFQPQQQGSVLQPLHLNALANIYNSSMDTSGLFVPCVVARLTQQVSLVPDNNIGMPVRSYFRTILEGSLTQPTPLQPTRVAYESDWEDKVHHFMYRNDLYPTVVSGHSFKAVLKSVVDTLGKGKEIKQLMSNALSTLNSLKATYNIAKDVAGPIVKVIAAKKKTKKSKKKGGSNKQVLVNNADVYRKVLAYDAARQSDSNENKSALVKVLNNQY